MRLLQRIFIVIMAALLPLGGALAEVRAAAVLDLTNARLLHADGSPYELPGIWYDLYRSSGAAYMAWGESRQLDASGEDYNSWYLGTCLGSCPSQFPPVETAVPSGGYASGQSSGQMQLGKGDVGASLQRAYAAATAPLSSSTSASVSLLIRLQPVVSESLAFAFDATPYLDFYRAPGTPDASMLWGGISLRISLFNVTTGEEVIAVVDDALNRSFTFVDGQPETNVVYDPGTLSFNVDLGTLDPAYDYEFRVGHSAGAGVTLAVPEPSAGSLTLAGIVVLGAVALRRRAAPAPLRGTV